MKKILRWVIILVPISSSILLATYFATSTCSYDTSLSFKHQDAIKLTSAPLRAVVKTRIDAPPEDVFNYISSSETMPEWIPGLKDISYNHSKSDSTGNLNQGSQRKMVFDGQIDVEEVVQFNRPNIVAYRILEGVPNHLAVMIVEDKSGDSTDFTWYQYFDIDQTSISSWLMPYFVRSFLSDAQSNLIQKFGGETVKLKGCY